MEAKVGLETETQQDNSKWNGADVAASLDMATAEDVARFEDDGNSVDADAE